LAGFALCTWVQVGYWRDSVTLWAHTIEVTGNSDLACCCLGIALRERGQIEAALPYLEEAATLAPRMAVARENLGSVLFVLGKNDRSREEYEALVQLKPNHAGARRTLAALSRKEGDLEQAAGHLRDALAIDPNDWQAHWGMGEVLVEQGQSEKGQWHLAEAARLNPQFSPNARAPALGSSATPPP
jgi:protein O-mannosyl-transferase